MRIPFLFYLLLFAIFAPTITQAQESDKKNNDSIRQKSTKGIKEKFPSTRILNFEYGQSFAGSYLSCLYICNVFFPMNFSDAVKNILKDLELCRNHIV